MRTRPAILIAPSLPLNCVGQLRGSFALTLLPARFGKKKEIGERSSEDRHPRNIGGMIGTTRARINLFMNRFRQLGLIDYKRGVGSSQFAARHLLQE